MLDQHVKAGVGGGGGGQKGKGGGGEGGTVPHSMGEADEGEKQPAEQSHTGIL